MRLRLQMNNKEMLDLLFISQKAIVFVFCVLFGFSSREAYQSLKPKYKFQKAIPKIILSFFICIISIPVLNKYEISKEYFPICIILISFLYMPIADFIARDLFPLMIKKISQNKEIKNDN